MNVQLTPAKPTERPTLEVRLDGVLIGVVEPYKDKEYAWHASLKIPTGKQYPDHVLIQGFAAEPEAAILKAFEEGLSFHENAIVAINKAFRQLHE